MNPAAFPSLQAEPNRPFKYTLSFVAEAVPGQQVTRAEAKEIIFDNDSRKRMQDGINKLADAVGSTLGPRGAAQILL